MKILVVISALCVALPFLYLLFKAALKRSAPFQKKNLLTENELEFFWRLTRALPDLFIFPQVAMSALIEPTANQGTKAHISSFGRISQKRVDYALYDSDMKIICVIELDDKTHNAAKDAARDQMLKSANIRTIRWDTRNKPQTNEIQEKVFADPTESMARDVWASRPNVSALFAAHPESKTHDVKK